MCTCAYTYAYSHRRNQPCWGNAACSLPRSRVRRCHWLPATKAEEGGVSRSSVVPVTVSSCNAGRVVDFGATVASHECLMSPWVGLSTDLHGPRPRHCASLPPPRARPVTVAARRLRHRQDAEAPVVEGQDLARRASELDSRGRKYFFFSPVLAEQ